MKIGRNVHFMQIPYSFGGEKDSVGIYEGGMKEKYRGANSSKYKMNNSLLWIILLQIIGLTSVRSIWNLYQIFNKNLEMVCLVLKKMKNHPPQAPHVPQAPQIRNVILHK